MSSAEPQIFLFFAGVVLTIVVVILRSYIPRPYPLLLLPLYTLSLPPYKPPPSLPLFSLKTLPPVPPLFIFGTGDELRSSLSAVYTGQLKQNDKGGLLLTPAQYYLFNRDGKEPKISNGVEYSVDHLGFTGVV